MSRKIEVVGHSASSSLALPRQTGDTSFTLSVSLSLPFRPQPIPSAEPHDNERSTNAVAVDALHPTASKISVNIYTSAANTPATLWTSVQPIKIHAQSRWSTSRFNSEVDSRKVSASYLRLLVTRRNRGERLGISVGAFGALALLLSATVLRLPLVTVLPGTIMLASVCGFMLLRRRLRGGAGRNE